MIIKIFYYHQKKIEAIKQELKKFNDYYRKLDEQRKVQERGYQLAGRQFGRDSLLFNQGVISNADFEKSESDLLGKVFSLKETETDLATARINVSQLNQQILDLELEYSREKEQKHNLLAEAYEKLKAEINIWKQKYLLISPINGTTSLTNYWSENQQVTEGETVATIIPKTTGNIIGKINLLVVGAGKVKEGQKVNIKFANYPFMEYGIVRGKVASISLVPNKNYYAAEVALPNGLITNYGNNIQFRQEMPGVAEIITENLSLLKRIINPAKSVIKRQNME